MVRHKTTHDLPLLLRIQGLKQAIIIAKDRLNTVKGDAKSYNRLLEDVLKMTTILRQLESSRP